MSYEDQQRVKTGSTSGTSSSFYGELTLSLWPSSISKRVQASAQTKRFVDANSSSGLNKRDVTYSTVGIDYYLYEPREIAIFTPIIGISREIGTDPIGGVFNSNRTTLNFKFKIN